MDLNSLEKLWKIISSGNPIMIFFGILIVAIPLLLNAAKLIELFSSFFDKRIKNCKEYLNNSSNDTHSQKFISDLLENELFSKSSNIRLDKKIRIKFIDLYITDNEKIDIKHFKKASPFFRLVGNDLKVKYSLDDKILSLIYFSAGCFFYFCGLLVFGLSIYSKGDFNQKNILLLKAIFFIIIGSFYFVLNWPFISVKIFLKEYPKLLIPKKQKKKNVRSSAPESTN